MNFDFVEELNQEAIQKLYDDTTVASDNDFLSFTCWAQYCWDKTTLTQYWYGGEYSAWGVGYCNPHYYTNDTRVINTCGEYRYFDCVVSKSYTYRGC